MNIGPVHLSAEQLGSNKWRLTVKYTATFSAQEVSAPLNFNFRDAFQIWEDDPVDDDQITGWVGVTNFNPAAQSVARTLTAEVSGDALDTELGGEEIKVRVRLRNVDLNFPIHRWSGIISLAP